MYKEVSRSTKSNSPPPFFCPLPVLFLLGYLWLAIGVILMTLETVTWLMLGPIFTSVLGEVNKELSWVSEHYTNKMYALQKSHPLSRVGPLELFALCVPVGLPQGD